MKSLFESCCCFPRQRRGGGRRLGITSWCGRARGRHTGFGGSDRTGG